MANELALTCGLEYSKNSQAVSIGQVFTITVAGNRLLDTTQSIGTSEEAIQLGELASLGFAYFENLDPTNYIELLTGTGGVKFAKLKAGEPAGPFRFGSEVTAPYAQANTGACLLRIIIFEA